MTSCQVSCRKSTNTQKSDTSFKRYKGYYSPQMTQYAPQSTYYPSQQTYYPSQQTYYQPQAQQYESEVALKQNGSKNNKALAVIVGIVLRILVVVGIPFAYYKFFTTFPLNILNALINLVTLNFSAIGEQFRNLLNIHAYIESFLWCLLSVFIAVIFIGYCYMKDAFAGGSDFKMIIKFLLKKLLPKFVLYIVPYLGQAIMAFELIKCFIKF